MRHDSATMVPVRALYLEPYASGSHQAFGETLTGVSWADWTVLTLPGRHWKWRMRGSAAYFARAHAQQLELPHELVFASAYLPLAELLGLAPKLARVPSVLYFHENQLAYPVRDSSSEESERDLHYAFTQLISALAATRCVFNSEYNRESFLSAATRLLARMPDAVAPEWVESIAARSEVLGLPLELPELDEETLVDLPHDARERGPLIVWNHRWEYDKGPERLVELIDGLIARGQRFRLAVCGQQFRRRPAVLREAETRWREQLGDALVQWGHLDSRAAYLALLGQAQLVLSTAKHEFFGISVLEAVHCGARPLVPDALSYGELLPPRYRYANDTTDAALDELERLCRGWSSGELELRADRRALTRVHERSAVLPRYRALLERLVATAPS